MAAGTYIVKYGAVPIEFGAVVPSTVACPNNESGNAGSYAELNNPDCSHNWGVTVTLLPAEKNWHIDFAFRPAVSTDLPWSGEAAMSERVYLPLVTNQ